MNLKISNRQSYLDATAGLLIIHMILGHIFQKAEMTDASFYKWMDILYFFLPWFFYKSGMFYKEGSTKSFLSKGGKKLLSEYLTWSITGTFILAFVECAIGDFVLISFAKRITSAFYKFEAVPGNLALWFLLALFSARFLFIVLKKIFSTDIIILISLGIVIANYLFDIHSPLWVVNIPAGLLFYAIGTRVGKLQENKYISIASLVLFVLLWVVCPSVVGFRSMSLLYGNFYLFILGSICGIISINYFFRMVPRISVLEYIGRNSMLYYVVHWPILHIGTLVTYLLGIEDKMKGFLVFIITEFVALSLITLYNELKKKRVSADVG